MNIINYTSPRTAMVLIASATSAMELSNFLNSPSKKIRNKVLRRLDEIETARNAKFDSVTSDLEKLENQAEQASVDSVTDALVFAQEPESAAPPSIRFDSIRFEPSSSPEPITQKIEREVEPITQKLEAPVNIEEECPPTSKVPESPKVDRPVTIEVVDAAPENKTLYLFQVSKNRGKYKTISEGKDAKAVKDAFEGFTQENSVKRLVEVTDGVETVLDRKSC